MTINRYSIFISVAVCVNAHTVTAAEDEWKAQRKAAESEPPAICASFAALVRGEIAKARAIKAALKSSETAPFFMRLFRNSTLAPHRTERMLPARLKSDASSARKDTRLSGMN